MVLDLVVRLCAALAEQGIDYVAVERELGHDKESGFDVCGRPVHLSGFIFEDAQAGNLVGKVAQSLEGPLLPSQERSDARGTEGSSLLRS